MEQHPGQRGCQSGKRRATITLPGHVLRGRVPISLQCADIQETLTGMLHLSEWMALRSSSEDQKGQPRPRKARRRPWTLKYFVPSTQEFSGSKLPSDHRLSLHSHPESPSSLRCSIPGHSTTGQVKNEVKVKTPRIGSKAIAHCSFAVLPCPWNMYNKDFEPRT